MLTDFDPNFVEVVYPLPDNQQIFTVDITENLTLLEVITQSGILAHYPEIDLAINKVGINGELKKLSDRVKPLDRVEIYRPLMIEPMAARRLRAAKQKLKSKG